MYFVYILISEKDGSHYVGTTTDVARRVAEHNGGNATYTSAHIPYLLSWYCGFPDEKLARNFERYLKQGSGHAFAKKHFLS